jgi:malonyl-CoA/methylmalonyl-CoA synthetase
MISTSLIEKFLQHCQQTPDKRCVVFESQTYSYADIRTMAAAWAGELRARGLQRGERVALFLDNGPKFISAYLGAQWAGGTVVLINTAYRQTELRHILRDAAPRFVVTDAQREHEIKNLEFKIENLEFPLAAPPDFPLSIVNSQFCDEVAIIAYTSGTTGKAKGAMLTHRNLAANVASVTEAWGWTSDDHLLLVLPLFHLHGLGVGFHGTIWAGASCELHPHFEVKTVYNRLLSGEPTMFFGVPTMYGRLLNEAAKRDQKPPNLRLYVSGSAALSADTMLAFERVFGQRILERYGMTETVMNTTNPLHGERRPGTVGQPFPRQEARVVHVRTRQPLPADEDGEIEVRGAHVFAGYLNQPEASAECFTPDGWFKTGDLGRVSADGYFTITGRAKELIISGGFNIYPREVEEVLAMHPSIAEVAVVGRPDPDFGESVTAVVVSHDATLNVDDLITYCKNNLASYKKPRHIIFANSLPRNALGKVQKHLL